MIVELITIGDEILDGRRIDTNSGWIGRRLTALGIPPRFRQSMTDRLEDIANGFNEALLRSDLILSTGGLGPTTDDLTFEALGKALKRKLIFHEDIYRNIQKRFADRGMDCPESNRRQAHLPEGGIPIDNEWGTAPGLKVNVGDKMIFCLPGVPLEMENLFEKGVYPEILKKIPRSEFSAEQIYKYVGISESHLEERVEKSGIRRISDGNVRIAYTASYPQIDVTIFVDAKSKEKLAHTLSQCDEALNRVLGEHLAVKGSETLEEKVVHLLQKKRWKIALAESFTGGMIASQIVNVSGSSEVFSSAVVAYSIDAKKKILNVSDETLKKFGAVSKECAIEMAHGIREMSGADCSISTTGFAEGKEPFGFIGWVGPGFEKAERYQFRSDRNRNRMLATFMALKGLVGQVTDQH